LDKYWALTTRAIVLNPLRRSLSRKLPDIKPE
jgi:hypothetical protein